MLVKYTRNSLLSFQGAYLFQPFLRRLIGGGGEQLGGGGGYLKMV